VNATFERLYRFQDEVLRLLGELETGFYLTGGTAASRTRAAKPRDSSPPTWPGAC
jgi:hypothetical protein